MKKIGKKPKNPGIEKWEKEKKKIVKKVEDGLPMVVLARIYGKEVRALIDSRATRCSLLPPTLILLN